MIYPRCTWHWRKCLLHVLRVELSVREKKPDPTFGFRIGKEDSDTLTGLTFSVPLFVRNTFSAEVDVANASLIQAERTAANVRRQARRRSHCHGAGL